MRFEFITPSEASLNETELQNLVTKISRKVCENIPGIPFKVDWFEPNDFTNRIVIRVTVDPLIQ